MSEDPNNNNDCPICLNPLPALSFRGNEFSRLVCCGNGICQACHQQYFPHALHAVLMDPSKKETCPICRSEVPTTQEQRIKLVRGHANKGKAWAEYALGNRYELGIGVAENHRTAHEWFAKAASKGYTAAEHAVGAQFLTGLGGKKDLNLAIKWLQKAATKQNAKAQFELGRIYLNDPRRFPEKRREALSLLQASADQQYYMAECELGYIYEHGDSGMSVDLKKAKEYYQRAALQDNSVAQFNLGSMYFRENDLPMAMFWLRTMKEKDMDAYRILNQVETALKQQCAACQKGGQLSGRCTRCKTYFYCSKDCQVKHWKDGHKTQCQAVKEMGELYQKSTAPTLISDILK